MENMLQALSFNHQVALHIQSGASTWIFAELIEISVVEQ